MKRLPKAFRQRGVLALEAESWGVEFSVIATTEGQPFQVANNVAVVDVNGPLTRDGGFFWDSYKSIAERAQAAFAGQCSAVMLRIDSPGGEAAGCFELADELRMMSQRSGKPLVAFVEGVAYSAGYAIACAASKIVVTPTAQVGSIGCIKMLVDQSEYDKATGCTFAVVTSGKRKADGNPHVPISGDALKASQSEIDEMAAIFFEHVAAARGLTVNAVQAFEADRFIGATAVASGLADQVATFEDLLAMVASSGINAFTGAETNMNEEMKKAIAALKALAAGDDEKAAKDAKAALAAMGQGDEGDSDKTKSEDDSDAPAPKKDDEEEKPSAEDEEEKPEAKASFSGAQVLALANKVNKLEASVRERDERDERRTLLASRPDFAQDVVALLQNSPIETVRTACKTLAKGPGPARSQVTSAIAAVQQTQAATRGDTQGEVEKSENAQIIDRAMGIQAAVVKPFEKGTKMFIPVMTPPQARAFIAAKGSNQ